MTSLHGRHRVVTVAVLCIAAACSGEPKPRGSGEAAGAPATAPPNRASLAARTPSDTSPGVSDDGQWIMPARNFASTRYSGLNQITAANAAQLRLAVALPHAAQDGSFP